MFFNRDKNKDYTQPSSSKRSERNLDKLNRRTGPGRYGLNLSKSVLKSAGRAFININPALKDTVTDNIDDIKGLESKYRDITEDMERSHGVTSSNLNQTVTNSIKMIKKIVSNSNKGSKQDSKELEDIGIKIDQDKFTFRGLEEESIEDEDTDTTINNSEIIIESSNRSVASLSSLMASSVVSLINVNKSGFDSVLSSLSETSGIDVEYYSDSIRALGSINERLDTLVKSSLVKNVQEATTSTSMEELMTGNLSISNFSKVIKDNILSGIKGNTKDDSTLAQRIIDSITSSDKSPKFLRDMLNLPKNKALDMFNYINDESIEKSSLFQKLRSRQEDKPDSWLTKQVIDRIVGNEMDGKKGISSVLRDLVIGKGMSVQGVDTSSKLSKSDKVNYDAETHNTINTVIPGYLARILSNINKSDDLMVHDYDSGRWMTSTKANEKYVETLKRTVSGDSRITQLLKDVTGDNTDLYGELTSNDEFTNLLYEHVLNPNSKAEDLLKSDNPELGKKLYELLKDDGNDFTKQFERAITHARAEVSKYNKSNTISGSMMNAFNDGKSFESEAKNSSSGTDYGAMAGKLFEALTGKEIPGMSGLSPSGGGIDLGSLLGSLGEGNISETLTTVADTTGSSVLDGAKSMIIPKETTDDESGEKKPSIVGSIGGSIKDKTTSEVKDQVSSVVKDKTTKIVGDFAKSKVGAAVGSGLKGKSSKLLSKAGRMIPKGGKVGTAVSVVGGLLASITGGRKKGKETPEESAVDPSTQSNDDLLSSASKTISDTLNREVPDLEEVNTFNLRDRISSIESGIRSFGGDFKDTLERKLSGRDKGKSKGGGIAQQLADTILGAGASFSKSSAGETFSRIVGTVANPKFIMPVMLAGAAAFGGKKLLDGLGKGNKDEFGGPEKKRGFFSNALLTVMGLGIEIIGGVSSIFSNIFGKKAPDGMNADADFLRQQEEAGADGDISEAESSAIVELMQNVDEEEQEDQPPEIDEDLQDGMKGVFKPSTKEQKDFEEVAEDSETVLSGEDERLDPDKEPKDSVLKKALKMTPQGMMLGGMSKLMSKLKGNQEDGDGDEEPKDSVLKKALKMTPQGMMIGGVSKLFSKLRGDNDEGDSDLLKDRMKKAFARTPQGMMLGGVSKLMSKLKDGEDGEGSSLKDKMKEIFSKTPQGMMLSGVSSLFSKFRNKGGDNEESSESSIFSRVTDMFREFTKGNRMSEMFNKNPREMAKKLMMFSPMGAANIMNEFGFSPTNPASGAMAKVNTFFTDITDKIASVTGGGFPSGGDGSPGGSSGGSGSPSSVGSLGGSSEVAGHYLDKYRVSSGFGKRSSPGGIGSTDHKGIDFAAKGGSIVGDNILAIADGKVIQSGFAGGAGNMVTIDHGGGFISKYMHMHKKPPVKVGQQVAAGSIIGQIGSSGNSTGPHLHLQLERDGKAFDPLPYLQELQKSKESSASVSTSAGGNTIGTISGSTSTASPSSKSGSGNSGIEPLTEERPKYLVDYDDARHDAVVERTKKKYFDIFGYNDNGSPDSDSSSGSSALTSDKNNSSGSNTGSSDGNKKPSTGSSSSSGSNSWSDWIDGGIKTDNDGNLIGPGGKLIKGSIVISIVNNTTNNTTNNSIADTDIDKLLVINNKSIDNLDKLLRATKNIGESTREALNRMIQMLELIKNQNELVGDNNTKSEATNELLRRLKVVMINISNSGGSGGSDGSGNDSNGNPITGDVAENFDFELEDNDLIRYILTGG